MFAHFSEFSPPRTSVVFIAEPAEVYPFFLDSAVVEGACGTHSVFAFTSATLAFGFSVVGRAEPTGKTANSDFNATYFHIGLQMVGD